MILWCGDIAFNAQQEMGSIKQWSTGVVLTNEEFW